MLYIIDNKASKLLGPIPMPYDVDMLDKLRSEIRRTYCFRYSLMWETPK